MRGQHPQEGTQRSFEALVLVSWAGTHHGWAIASTAACNSLPPPSPTQTCDGTRNQLYLLHMPDVYETAAAFHCSCWYSIPVWSVGN